MLYFLKNQQKNIFQGLPQDYEERKMEQNKCAVTSCTKCQKFKHLDYGAGSQKIKLDTVTVCSGNSSILM